MSGDEMTAHDSTEAPGDHDPLDLTESDQDSDRGAVSGMGVSSERVGPTGPGQHGTTGVRDVGPAADAPAQDALPEQSVGGPETNPDGIAPRSGYPDDDPRSDGDTPSRPRAEREVDRRPDAG